jgi:prepilin signal peptidase PulO-like enzyme (type II secretory pathway)
MKSKIPFTPFLVIGSFLAFFLDIDLYGILNLFGNLGL